MWKLLPAIIVGFIISLIYHSCYSSNFQIQVGTQSLHPMKWMFESLQVPLGRLNISDATTSGWTRRCAVNAEYYTKG
ncbi:hypothetical protein BD779DRAFT_514393 [Infundibulicybe gibba]|nr:hypothetical protein BD779DRAFT_514393 [Infundibulicybe gibba]